jgi:hypothetical protein
MEAAHITHRWKPLGQSTPGYVLYFSHRQRCIPCPADVSPKHVVHTSKPIDGMPNSPYWTSHGDPLFQRCLSSLAGLPLEPPCASYARIGTKQAKGLNA